MEEPHKSFTEELSWHMNDDTQTSFDCWTYEHSDPRYTVMKANDDQGDRMLIYLPDSKFSKGEFIKVLREESARRNVVAYPGPVPDQLGYEMMVEVWDWEMLTQTFGRLKVNKQDELEIID